MFTIRIWKPSWTSAASWMDRSPAWRRAFPASGASTTISGSIETRRPSPTCLQSRPGQGRYCLCRTMIPSAASRAGYPTHWLDPNNAYLFSKYFDPNLLNTPSNALDLGNQSHLLEGINAAYGMISFAGTLGAVPFSGNLGVRVARTKQTSS